MNGILDANHIKSGGFPDDEAVFLATMTTGIPLAEATSITGSVAVSTGEDEWNRI